MRPLLPQLLLHKNWLRADNELVFKASQIPNGWWVRNLTLTEKPELDEAIVPTLPMLAWLVLMASLVAVFRWQPKSGIVTTLLILGFALSADTHAAKFKVTYIHNDHLGRPTAGTDEAGQLVWSAGYHPFGEIAWRQGEVPSIAAFPGQYRDGDSGLLYNYQRWYDPSIGRYITSDPIGLSGGLNTYLYANANPQTYTDRTGLAIDVIPDIGLVIYDLYRLARDNAFGSCDNLGLNLAALGADVGAVFIPGVTGAGLGVRAGARVGPKGGGKTLYRAVGADELADIQAGGKYRAP